MKKWNKTNRVFMNAKDKSCRDAIYWSVECYVNRKGMAEWTGEICGPRHLSHWLNDRKDLAPLKVMRAELDKFEDTLMLAIAQCEEHNDNAKS